LFVNKQKNKRRRIEEKIYIEKNKKEKIKKEK